MPSPDVKPGGGASSGDASTGFIQIRSGSTKMSEFVEGKGVVEIQVPVNVYKGEVLNTEVTVVTGKPPSGVEGTEYAQQLAGRYISAILGSGEDTVVAKVKREDIPNAPK